MFNAPPRDLRPTRSPLTRPPRRSPQFRTHPAELELLERRQLFVADPVTVAHPMWFANYGTVVVDGVIDPAEWAGSIPITRAQANRPDSAVTMRFKYTELGLYIAAEVSDQFLWADGAGGGSGPRADWYDDDSLALFFDASVTRKRLMTPDGRALAFNIGPVNGPVNGSGVVSRYSYIKGNNDLTGLPVNPNGALAPGITWKTVLHGTPNNNSDIDQGWTTEVFLPWAALGMVGMPVNGQNITMNYSVLFDDNNSTHNATPRDNSPNPNLRFGPAIADDQINGVDSSFNTITPGMEGPIDYAWLTFTDPRTNDKPNPVINLSVGSVDGYSARLNFLAPAASSAVMALGPAKRGGVYQYQIRWSETPITDEDSWDFATEIANTFVPHPRGQPDSLHIASFEPDTEYYVAIRAVDGAGRLSNISQVVFTTLDETQDPSDGDRTMNSPAGGSLVTEAGDPFVMVGSTLTPSDLYVRNLYNGNVWDAAHNRMVNYSVTPGSEGDAAGYFQALADSGVNTLRISLESLALPPAGQSQLPGGMYWLEYPAGNYNLNMKTFLWNMMAQAGLAGIKLILQPFDTADYKTYFNLTPYSAQRGGPLQSINDFFQSPAMITMVANRINTIIDWIHQSPDDTSVLGIELPDDWDDLSWTKNARGDGDPTRMQEFRDRSKFILRAAAAVHAHDPNMLLVSSTTNVDPTGAEARALFLGDNIDMLAPHWDTPATAEPVNSPDVDPSIRPVTVYAALAGYWLSSKRDQRVVNNGQWGLDPSLWPGAHVYYTGISPNPVAAHPWTLQEDIDLFRTTSWTQIAMGLGGSGFRKGGQEMRDLVPANIGPGATGYLPLPLPQAMRDIQFGIASFATDFTLGFDYTSYQALPLAGRIAFSGTSKRLIGMGSTDGSQGMVYVTQDLNRSQGSVNNASLIVSGLGDGAFVDVEFWSTGSDSQQLDVQWGIQVVNGKLTIPLPAFSKDVMVRFKTEEY